jgi:hypothetical protein
MQYTKVTFQVKTTFALLLVNHFSLETGWFSLVKEIQSHGDDLVPVIVMHDDVESEILIFYFVVI